MTHALKLIKILRVTSSAIFIKVCLAFFVISLKVSLTYCVQWDQIIEVSKCIIDNTVKEKLQIIKLPQNNVRFSHRVDLIVSTFILHVLTKLMNKTNCSIRNFPSFDLTPPVTYDKVSYQEMNSVSIVVYMVTQNVFIITLIYDDVLFKFNCMCK